mgnify:CR=1 FL=1
MPPQNHRSGAITCLGCSTVIYALNFLDRTIFNVLIEPIKRSSALSDTDDGPARGLRLRAVLFAARHPDRARRRPLQSAATSSAIALAFWSAMTVLLRHGAERGDAGAGANRRRHRRDPPARPASQSIIADLFNKNERPRALGVYAIGTYLGVFLGYFIGGYVNQYYGWRMAFFAAGLPGIALAAVLWLTVSEPKRGAMAETFTPEPIGPTARLSRLAADLRHPARIGFCLTTHANYATAAWIPPFLARVHHLISAEIGTYAGTFKGLCGIAGTLLGGLVVAQISRRDDRWKLWAPAITSGLAGPVFALCMLTSDFTTMVAALAPTSFLVGFHLGPIFAIAQTVAKPSMRALASAHHAADGRRFWPGRRPARGRHAQRRAEERFRRPGRALLAAVGRGHDHARRLVVRLGGAVDTGRYSAGELIRPDSPRPPHCFY